MTKIDTYDYELPEELVAQFPLSQRTDARLLVIDRSSGTIEHYHIRDLPQILNTTDTLVFNDTRVVPARLTGFRTKTKGRWNGLFLAVDEGGIWHVMSKTRGRLEPGETVTLVDRAACPRLVLRLLKRLDDGTWLAKPEVDRDYLEVLDEIGRVPLPHYIRGGEMTPNDQSTYQTVFAQHPGAVAAPTAGLHFTEPLLNEMKLRGIKNEYVTLHVGLGTFRPVTAGQVEEHEMHQEWGNLPEDVAERLRGCRAAGARLVAVGTTSVRVLETAAQQGRLMGWQGQTDLFIRPPYAFRAVDALLTNFHLPKSTLLVLVRTFGGEDLIQRAYAMAIQERYRFFSYGDAMLIL